MTDVSNRIIKTITITMIKVAMPNITKPVVILDGLLFPLRSLLNPWISRAIPTDKQTIKPRMMIIGDRTNKSTNKAELYKYIKNNNKAVNPVNKTLSTIQPAKTILLLCFLFPSVTKSTPVTARTVIATIMNMNRANGPILYILPSS